MTQKLTLVSLVATMTHTCTEILKVNMCRWVPLHECQKSAKMVPKCLKRDKVIFNYTLLGLILGCSKCFGTLWIWGGHRDTFLGTFWTLFGNLLGSFGLRMGTFWPHLAPFGHHLATFWAFRPLIRSILEPSGSLLGTI